MSLIDIPAGFIEEIIGISGVTNDIYHYGGNTDSQTNTQIHIAAFIASKAQQSGGLFNIGLFRTSWGANIIATTSAIHILNNDLNDPTKGNFDIIADFATVFGDLASTAATVVNFLPGVNPVVGKRLSLVGNILTFAGIFAQNPEKLAELVDWAHTQLVEIGNEVSSALSTASSAVIAGWEATKTTLLDAANSVVNAINSVGTAAFDATVQAAVDLFNGADAVLTNFQNSTGVAIQSISEVLTATGVAIYDAAGNIVVQFGTLSNQISDAISAAYWKFLDSIAKSLIDPLIIDLSNNGIALDSWQASAALFDLNGDGTKENTGWTKANGDDAFLVIDKNSNGNIDNITEMFGNASIPGFTELAKYDSNKDNLINSLDSQFSLLRLWNDKNANGTVDTGEMTTLATNDNTPLFELSKVA